MKTLKQYICERAEEPKVYVHKFYRANIGRMWEEYDGTLHKIGEVTEITRKYYSNYDKSYTFGEPTIGKERLGDWEFAIAVKPEHLGSPEECETYLNSLNKKDEFYQYFIDKEDAESAAAAAKKKFESTKWTLESVLEAIKKYAPLNKLGYNYKITDTFQQRNKIDVKAIYVSSAWRIRVTEKGYIELDNAGWHTYRVPNIPSLYKVLNAENEGGDSSDKESDRCNYSIVV